MAYITYKNSIVKSCHPMFSHSIHVSITVHKALNELFEFVSTMTLNDSYDITRCTYLQSEHYNHHSNKQRATQWKCLIVLNVQCVYSLDYNKHVKVNWMPNIALFCRHAPPQLDTLTHRHIKEREGSLVKFQAWLNTSNCIQVPSYN